MLTHIAAPTGCRESIQAGSACGRPPTWVAFSADLKITNPKRADAFGRYLQDEHGCIRRETVHPDRSLMVTINNFQIGKTYTLMRGAWTSQDMRLVPGMPRRPRQTRVDREAGPIEGFKAYVSMVPVRSPRGDYIREATVIPALNFLEALQTVPNGDTIIAGLEDPITPSFFLRLAPRSASLQVSEALCSSGRSHCG